MLRDLKDEYGNDNVLIVEQDVDAPLGARLDRWLEANTNPGTIYLPLVMTDSGHDISNGSEDFEAVYRQMINRSLNRSASASMAVEAVRSNTILRLDVRLTNRSGETLSAANDATVTALVWEAPADPNAVPVVAAGRTAAVPTLTDGATGELTLEVVVGGLDAASTRWVVIADYRPDGPANPYDTLQAVAGP